MWELRRHFDNALSEGPPRQFQKFLELVVQLSIAYSQQTNYPQQCQLINRPGVARAVLKTPL